MSEMIENQDLTRSRLARIALAAWVNVEPDALPADKMWIEHPNDVNRQAWDRVVAALSAALTETPWLRRVRMSDEPWRKAKTSMPDVMRIVYTDPDANAFHPKLAPREGDYWPEHPVVAIIGPFDNHMGQPELQERLLAVIRQWNAEAAERALAATETPS